MSTELSKPSKRILEPYDRISEILFGLIMVLTFTGSLSVSEATREDVRSMLIGALGCNLAWGIIDSLFYLMGCLSEKARGLHELRAVHQSKSPAEARHLISQALPSVVSGILSSEEIESIRLKLQELPQPPLRPSLSRTEWMGALTVFFLVFLITLPVAVPFMFMKNLSEAMRVSNAIAIALLFMGGVGFGRVVGYRPLPAGLTMVLIGSVIVALTIALGG